MRFRGDISNSDDFINSKDVEYKIDDLTEEIDSLQEEIDELEEKIEGAEDDSVFPNDLTDDLKKKKSEQADLEAELKLLEDFKNDFVGYCDWYHGENLISDRCLLGFIKDEIQSEYEHLLNQIPSWMEIDWGSTIENLKQDYTSGEWDGEEYWVRS